LVKITAYQKRVSQNLFLFLYFVNKMTRSSDDNMASVAGEVNQMDADYGKNFKILNPNDQIKGE
jgi:hypothetical protein